MRWKLRGRDQGSGIGGQGGEVGSQESEVRSQKSEVRGQKSEVKSRRSKVRSQKSKIESQKSKIRSGFQPLTSGLRPLTSVFRSLISGLRPLISVFWLLLSGFLLFGEAGAVGAFEEVGADTTHADSVTVKSPMGALGRSMLVPGWGQWYNERPIKGAVIFSTELFLGGAMVYEQRRTLDRQQRNTYFLWFLGVFLYNIADAYVDAHLYGFEEDAERDFQNPENFENLQTRGTLQARMGGLNVVAVPRLGGLLGYGGDILIQPLAKVPKTRGCH